MNTLLQKNPNDRTLAETVAVGLILWWGPVTMTTDMVAEVALKMVYAPMTRELYREAREIAMYDMGLCIWTGKRL